MIYLFTWNSEYLIKEEVKKWKKHFLTKFWDFNLLEIEDILSLDKNFISENFLGTSFMAWSKLIIVRNIEKVEKKESKESIDDEKKDKNDWKKEFLISLFSKIPEQNIIVFTSSILSEKSTFYKELSKVWEIKKFEIKNSFDTKLYLDKKYSWNVDSRALDKIISYKSNNLSKIVLELDKLFIIKEFIKEKDVTDFILPELEETIFAFVDKLLNKDNTLFSDLDYLLTSREDIYAFYNMLLWNLRTAFYIAFFKELWYSKNHIVNELSLWTRWFLADKSHKMKNNEIINLYLSLISFDKNMKSWKLIWSNFEDLKYEIEKILTKI